MAARNWNKETEQGIRWLFWYCLVCVCCSALGAALVVVNGILAWAVSPLLGFGMLGLMYISIWLSPIAVIVALWKYKQLGKKTLYYASGSVFLTYGVITACLVLN